MKHKIEIYVDEIFFKEKTITDAEEIADVICRHVKHLGSMSFYVTPKPKTFFQKLMRSLGISRFWPIGGT